jgi:hypothetical protein
MGHWIGGCSQRGCTWVQRLVRWLLRGLCGGCSLACQVLVLLQGSDVCPGPLAARAETALAIAASSGPF